MEKFKPQKSTYESSLGSFETDEVRQLQASDIGTDDRAFVSTMSGNRYMLRHSQSRGEALVIYSERDGFDEAHARPFRVRQGTDAIATVGAPLNYFAITDEEKQTGNEVTSTEVTRIEIRRGIEAAIRKAGEGRGGFGGIADALKAQTHGRRTGQQ